jgi:hypothetical protein
VAHSSSSSNVHHSGRMTIARGLQDMLVVQCDFPVPGMDEVSQPGEGTAGCACACGGG